MPVELVYLQFCLCYGMVKRLSIVQAAAGSLFLLALQSSHPTSVLAASAAAAADYYDDRNQTVRGMTEKRSASAASSGTSNVRDGADPAVSVTTGCRFPTFLQTNVGPLSARNDGDDRSTTGPDWRTHWRDIPLGSSKIRRVRHHRRDSRNVNGATAAAVVTFLGSVMRSTDDEEPEVRNSVDNDSQEDSFNDEDGPSSPDVDKTNKKNDQLYGRFTYIRECQSSVLVKASTSTGNRANVRRYLVTHREPKEADSRYLCIEFVARSKSFIQIRQTPITTTFNSSTCLDERQFIWNPWPLIDVRRFFTSYERCPLDGGYSIRLYDRRQRLGVCDAYDSEVRMESECGFSWISHRAASAALGGDIGLTFRFRYPNCVPEGLRMRPTQRTLCAVSWTVDDDGSSGGREGTTTTFIVLRHDSLEHAWCFRFSTGGGGGGGSESRSQSGVDRSALGQFSGYLFVGGLRCDVGPVGGVNGTIDYIRVDSVRDADLGYHRGGRLQNATLDFPAYLCADDYEACTYWSESCSRKEANMLMKLTCSKSCGECVPGQRPAACPRGLPAEFRGVWSEFNDQEQTRITIDDDLFVMHNYNSFRCINWSNKLTNDTSSSSRGAGRPTDEIHDSMTVWEQLFVTSSHGTGCRPRYACVQIKRRSASILQYRISQSEDWPPVGFNYNLKSAADFNCGLFRYRDDVAPFGSTYHSKHFKIIVRQASNRTYTDCLLPRTVSFKAQLMTSSVTCRGRLGLASQTEVEAMTLTYTDGCPAAIKTELFRCLDSNLNEYGDLDLIIISESMINRTIVCWLFTTVDNVNVIYRLRAADCHHGVSSRIASRVVKPEVTLTEVFDPELGEQNALSIGWYGPSTTKRPPLSTTSTYDGFGITNSSTAGEDQYQLVNCSEEL